jgi:hypothetical protein
MCHWRLWSYWTGRAYVRLIHCAPYVLLDTQHFRPYPQHANANSNAASRLHGTVPYSGGTYHSTIQVEVFRGCDTLNTRGSVVHLHVGIRPQRYTATQTARPRLESSFHRKLNIPYNSTSSCLAKVWIWMDVKNVTRNKLVMHETHSRKNVGKYLIQCFLSKCPLTLTPWSRYPSWEANSHSAGQEIPPVLRIPRSQDPATGPYPEPYVSSPHPYNLFL